MSIRHQDTFIAVVRPTFLSADHPLRRVDGAYNAVSVYGNASGHTLFYGQGAGGKPTASAVIADIIGVLLRGDTDCVRALLSLARYQPHAEDCAVVRKWSIATTYDWWSPIDRGYWEKITNIFGDEQLNIAAIHQHLPTDGRQGSGDGKQESGNGKRGSGNGKRGSGNGKANVVVTLHAAQEARVLSAVKRLRTIADRGVSYTDHG